MSGLYATLNSTVKAITAHSRAIETTGKNLANVNNTSYARQRVIYGDRGTVQTADGAESLGLEAMGVQQLRDQLLDNQVSREISRTSGYEAEQSAYQRAQAGLGQSITRTSSTSTTGTTDNGIGAAIDKLFNSFQSFASSTTDTGIRSSLIQNAKILTDRFQLADQRLAQVQSDLDKSVNTDVASVNTLLTTISDLNAQIGRFEVNAPGSAVDLRDQRQAKLEELAAKIPFTVRDQGNGQVQLVAKDSSGNSVLLVDQGSVPGEIQFNGTEITGAGGAVLSLDGGSIQGSLSARNGGVQDLRNNLNALAKQIVTSVNAAYNPTGSTGDFFDAAGLSAGTIALNSSVTSSSLKASNGGVSGDNEVALAVAALADHTFSTPGDSIDGTFSAYFDTTVSSIGQALSGANARVNDQTNIEKLVRSQRDAVSGVSLDEEISDLMKFQRAFQASSRVFTVVDSLLETVVNLGR